MTFWAALDSNVTDVDGYDELERRLIGFFLLKLPSMARYSALFCTPLLLMIGWYRWLRVPGVAVMIDVEAIDGSAESSSVTRSDATTTLGMPDGTNIIVVFLVFLK
jgi:hypothetical protein